MDNNKTVTGRRRPDILIIGGDGGSSRVIAALLALDFVNIERRCIAHLGVLGREANLGIIDDLEHMPLPSRVYDWKQEPADGPERRKEPKGPRGRWGKL